MAEYLHALLGPSGTLPWFGDDDGGRVFHPYGDRTQFGRETMAACAVIFGRREAKRASRLFPDAGVAVMCDGDVQVVIKAGGFGEGSGGHSHSDVLSMVLRIGDREILIDPGTFTYIADPAERDAFRGSAAHNTVRIDGRDQAVPAGPFRWNEKPAVVVNQWATSAERDYLDATCSYGGFQHRRRVLFAKPSTVVVLDRIDGAPGEHTVEQFWHLGAEEDAGRFSFSAPVEKVETWRSRALCMKERAAGLRIAVSAELPVEIAAVIDLSAEVIAGPVEVRGDEVMWRNQVLTMAV